MPQAPEVTLTPDYLRSLVDDLPSFLVIQVAVIALVYSKPPLPGLDLNALIAAPAIISVLLFALRCFTGWGTITLNDKGLTIKRLWGEQFYAWNTVDCIYAARVHGQHTGLISKVFIATVNQSVGYELTAYPYRDYNTKAFIDYLNAYREPFSAQST